jgi:hypothetical protein
MNKTNKLSYILPVIIIALIFAFSAFDSSVNTIQPEPVIKKQERVNKPAELVSSRKSTAAFENVSLFNRSAKDNRSALASFVSKASFLTVDKSSLSRINSSKPSEMTLQVPDINGGIMEVELVRVSIVPEDFKIKIITGGTPSYVDFNEGVYYQGIIKGNERSIATLSVFDNNVMGIFSTEQGNFVLGSVKNGTSLTNEYILYNDLDALNKPDFHCGAGDTYSKFYKDPVKRTEPGTDNPRTTAPVNIAFTCDYQMYVDNGSNVNTTGQFVTGVFNHVKTLYANEQLVVQISEIGVITASANDPYRQYTTSQTPEILTLFGDNTQNNINGDLAHLLSTRTPVMGGIAWVNVLCQSYEPTSHSGRYAFSQIENDYQPYPVFSWTVTVITHETGHNFGSMHTQSCVWPSLPGGGIGAIDSCVDAEGNCFTTTRPNQNGTIMSYCHLNGSINYFLGFGDLPGDTIRGRYHEALCLDSGLNSSELPLDFVLLQNYPNPFNPSTNIKFALPQAGLVTLRIYDVTGREVATLINNAYYAIGIFSYTLDASVYNLASGVYLYKVDVNRDNKSVYSEIKKMVLVK